eukprot:CAMPEP_0194748226 /NCGR_PEP_ID=MMETSP0323_2-20130528/2390_1 /TAXON_ID=2866 ORGANISM="Crypthecodinium cohnii, Strain Seligo" /NCGR_SAMPLE_ID=MMETSP0323_2 /ASSEMBLY_ACC=CAM_ASM_000346 /LENGTH=170 /DNA_ID=CAMNT_0039662315 /DNA_START=415 /DNA_END=924 /DNA_ORIENTATION=+
MCEGKEGQGQAGRELAFGIRDRSSRQSKSALATLQELLAHGPRFVSSVSRQKRGTTESYNTPHIPQTVTSDGATGATSTLAGVSVNATILVVFVSAQQSDVAILSPVISPGVLDDPVLVAALIISTETNGNNRMVDDGILLAAVEDPDWYEAQRSADAETATGPLSTKAF